MEPTAPGFAEHLADALSRAMAPAAERVDALRTDIHTAEQERRRANRINTGVLLVLAILVVLLGVLGVFTLRIATQAEQTNARVADCTTAGGTCYERGRAQTAGAVGDIVRSSIYVIECARTMPDASGPVFDAAVERCVAAKLAHPDGTPAGPSSSPRPAVSPSPSGTG